MKTITTLGVALWLGLSLTANAQLLYQWTFTNSTDTVSNSAATYAVTPGTGNLLLQNISGNIFTAGVGSDGINPPLYFTNSNNGPGSGPGVNATGALVANGQGYNGGNSAIAIATNLNLGNQYQVTVTFWVKMGTSVAGQFPRFAQFVQNSQYDIGNKGSGNHNDIGASINYVSPAVQMQNSVASGTGAYGSATSVTGLSNFPGGLPADGSTWIFEALTYDATVSSTNFTTWLGTSTLSVQPVTVNANFGPISFTTNATVIIGGCGVAATPRGLSSGAIADVRIYGNILSSNDVEKVRTFQVYTPPINPITNASIISQPVSGKNFVGGSRSFNVVASGNPATFTYLWSSNGVPITSATNSTLILTNIQVSANAASFVCSVSNVIGGANSLPATLTVSTPQPNSFNAVVMAANPYSFWKVNEPSNSTAFTVFDYANGHDGTAVDPLNMLFLSGPSSPLYPGFLATNSAIEALGNFQASRLNMANPGNFPNTGMTMCGWILTPGSPTANGLMFDLVSDTGGGFGLTFNGANTVSYQWGQNAPTSGFVGGTFVPNQWTFVALVVSTNLTAADIANSITADTNATIYVCSPSTGVLSASDSTALNSDLIGSGTSAAPFTLGRIASAASDNGSFYQANTVAFSSVAIFYSALSPQTITNLYQAGAGSNPLPLSIAPDPSTPGNLLVNWIIGTLQESTSVAGPYNDEPTYPTPPYSVPRADAQHYYRLRN
jgi:hypothetical protein